MSAPAAESGAVPAILRELKKEVAGRAAVIGFCGAPWTLATYAIEGGGSKSFQHTKTMMWREPKLLEALLSKLADAVGDYLAAQVEAGADVVQVFDSWAGELSRADYDRFAGQTVAVTTYAPVEGQRRFTGRLEGIREGRVAVLLADGREVMFPPEAIAGARLVVDEAQVREDLRRGTKDARRHDGARPAGVTDEAGMEA